MWQRTRSSPASPTGLGACAGTSGRMDSPAPSWSAEYSETLERAGRDRQPLPPEGERAVPGAGAPRHHRAVQGDVGSPRRNPGAGKEARAASWRIGSGKVRRGPARPWPGPWWRWSTRRQDSLPAGPEDPHVTRNGTRSGEGKTSWDTPSTPVGAFPRSAADPRPSLAPIRPLSPGYLAMPPGFM